MDVNLHTLKSRLINLSTSNSLIKVNPKGKFQFDLSEVEFSDNEFEIWLNNPDDILSIDLDNIPKALLERLTKITNNPVIIPDWAKYYIDDAGEIDKIGIETLSQEEVNELSALSKKVKEFNVELNKRQKEVDNWDKRIHTKLKKISNKHIEIKKESGRYSLYIGYMYIRCKLKAGANLNAPLILIPISISQNATRTLVEHDTDRDIKINTAALMAITRFLGYKAHTKFEECSNFSDIGNISDFISGIPKLKIQDSDKLTSIESYDMHIGDVEIYKASSIGIYNLSSSIYNDYTRIEEQDGESPIINKLFNISDKQYQTGNSTHEIENETYIEPKWKAEELNCISLLDQSQEYAVFMANKANGLVIYGPPGTGKSQVILNIISDQMAKGKRILLVSQKITALRVVYNRLGNMQRYAMIVEDSGGSRKEFAQHTLDALDMHDSEATINYNDKLAAINSKIDSLVHGLDLIHKQLTTPIDITRVSLSFMYKHSKTGDAEDNITLDVMNRYHDLFKYSLKEIYNSRVVVDNDVVQQSYKIWSQTPNLDTITNLSRLKIKQLRDLYMQIRWIKSEISRLNEKIDREMIDKNASSKYKNMLKLDETLSDLIDILYEDDYEASDCGINIIELSYDQIYSLQEEINKLYKLYIGRRYIEFDGIRVGLKSIEYDIRKGFEDRYKQSIDKQFKLASILKEYDINDTGEHTVDIDLESIDIDRVTKVIDLYNEVRNDIGLLLNEYNINIIDYNDDSVLYNSILAKLDYQIKLNLSTVDRAIQLYPNIEINSIASLKDSDIDYYIDNIDKLTPKPRSILSKLITKYDDQDKNNVAILMSLKDQLNARMDLARNNTQARYNAIQTKLNNLSILMGHIKLYSLGISNVDIIFKDYISNVNEACTNFTKEFNSKVDSGIECVKEILEAKNTAENNLADYTQNIASIIGCSNESSEIKNSAYKLQDNISEYIKEQFSLIDRLNCLTDQLDSVESTIEDDFPNISNISIEILNELIQNNEALVMIKELTDLDRLLLKIHTQLEIGYDSIINAYITYYIDYIESSGIGTNLNNKYRDYIYEITKLENEKAKLVKQSISKQIRSNRNIDVYKLMTIKSDLSKVRKNKSIRQLMNEYSTELYQLFPVWMMTPETVSDILPLASESFDIAIFDEASQMYIENSIPSLYRCKRAIIAGDDKQLKPTSFFSSKNVESEYEEEDIELAGESLLDQAKITFNSVHLNFHYRSKYAQLIQFSNFAFYNSRLKISPNILSEHSGYKPIEYINCHGEFKDGTNETEAIHIAKLLDAILSNAETQNKTVGIITFNIKQKECVEETIHDYIENVDCDKQQLFRELMNKEVDGEDISLFVKNIEDVQGDERDIIIFSLGYGVDDTGKLNVNLGPLRLSGGENRLNVAISRAKEKEYVIASIEPSELNVENSKNRGPKIFKDFLYYAKAVSDGDIESANSIIKSDKIIRDGIKFDSPFEKDVYEHLVDLGWHVDTQVGVMGYRIDLAIYDEISGKYIAGIECDGATYHSSKYAKERDVSRQRFLEGKGWRILRIWSKNWWHNSSGEIQRIHQQLLSIQNNEHNEIRDNVLDEKEEYISIDNLAATVVPDLIISTDEQEEIALDKDIDSVKQPIPETDHLEESITLDEKKKAEEFIHIHRAKASKDNTIDLTNITKEDVKGQKLQSIEVSNLYTLSAKQWWRVLHCAILYRVVELASASGYTDLEQLDKNTKSMFVKSIFNDLGCPSYISNNELDLANPTNIEGTYWFFDKKCDSYGMLNRANKVLGNRYGIISLKIGDTNTDQDKFGIDVSML